MKRRLKTLSGRYLAELQNYLKQGAGGNLGAARGLGRHAAAIGVQTLDVARIHEGALAALEGSSSKDGIIEQAEVFFAEAITPIEETHRAALKAAEHVRELNRAVSRRDLELAAANRSLKKGIARRRTVEVALRKSGKHYKTLLQESLALQKHLQRLTHRILWAQENKRKKISHELQDEITQTLLGINVRLLTLKAGATRNARSLNEDIARTQRVVDKSAQTIAGFARKYAKHHEP
jgi:signal transduction histidine kinase